MQRRGGHRQNVKRRRTAKVKTRKTPAANTSQRLERLTRERDEALDQQAATAEVLSVAISGRSQEISFAGFVAGAARVRLGEDLVEQVQPVGPEIELEQPPIALEP